VLYAEKVSAALHERRDAFTRQESVFQDEIDAYRAALADLRKAFVARADLTAALDAAQARGERSIGARPAAAYAAWRAAGTPDLPVLPFGTSFEHHADARNWAEHAIAGTTTVAVDGSQIMPWRDASIPVALVQAGIFANPHDPQRPYLKDVRVEVLGRDDLIAPDADSAEDVVLGRQAEELVNLRRFELEARTLAEWMAGWRPQQDDSPPIALLDGSLIVSFALTLPPSYRERYVAAATHLLATSAETRVPLIAYIDNSLAGDLTTMLRVALPERALPRTKRISDALLWNDLLEWGDCTLPFVSARGDVLGAYGEHAAGVAFAYLCASMDRPPARIELPLWLAESDDLARVLAVLRAELIAGGGYPYAIETADAVAVIGLDERQKFYRLFQDFAEDAGIPLNFTRKIRSKARRR
jgi:hypothetical protein